MPSVRNRPAAGSPPPEPARPWWQSRSPRASFVLAGIWLLLALVHALPGRSWTGLSVVLLVVESVLFTVYLVAGLRQLRRRG